MTARILFVLIIFCTACQSGRIPCPDARGPKARKVKVNSRKTPEYSASARKEMAESRNQALQGREQDIKYIRNVSVEEWDCPRPGDKKYMPRSVKENIRRNMKRINEGDKTETDSTGVR